ncbi:hypothetical protein LCGC14_2491540, partial [marine sediment metagenome]
MKKAKGIISTPKIILLGILFGVAVGLINAIVDVIFVADRTFIEHLFSPAPIEIWMRSVVLVLFILFSVYLSRTIKKLKRAEEEVHNSGKRFKEYYERAPLGYQSLDENGCFLDVNTTWLNTFGYSREDVIGKWFGDLLASPKDRDSYKANFQRFKETGKISGVEYTVKRKDNSTIEVSFDGSISKDMNGAFKQTHCILHDITERKRARKALEESESRYRFYVKNFKGIAFRGHLNFIPIFFHGSVEEITGYTENELLSGNPSWDKVVYEDDLHLLQDSIENLRTVPDFSVEREYRIVRKDGELRWLFESIQNICDDSMTPQYVQGALHDITERKKAEEELKESEEKFRALFDYASDSILLMRLEEGEAPVIIDANAATCSMHGYTKEELVGQPISMLDDPETAEQVKERARRVLAGESLTFEGRHVRKDGTVFPVEISTCMFNIGKDKYVLGIDRDITERKRAKAEISS